MLETTGSVWDINDMVAPSVIKTVVTRAQNVRQIDEARLKTDQEDIRQLLSLLIADIVLEVWVPSRHVRELALADLLQSAAEPADHHVQ